MSIVTRQSALACIFTSLLVATAARSGEPPPDPGRVAGLELEVGLARRPDIYLVLDAKEGSLQVKARGIVLDSAPVSGIEVVTKQPLLGPYRVPSLTLPAVWTIEHGAGDKDREVIAPTELRPYTSDDVEDESTPGAKPAGSQPPPTATPIPEPPVSFEASTDSGWDLRVSDRFPPQGFLGRFLAAAHDGWRRLRGVHSGAYVPSIMIVLRPEDARRLHHLFRKGRAVLLLP